MDGRITWVAGCADRRMKEKRLGRPRGHHRERDSRRMRPDLEGPPEEVRSKRGVNPVQTLGRVMGSRWEPGKKRPSTS